MVVQRKGEPPPSNTEAKKLRMMRQALARATTKNNIGGKPKSGHHLPKPITLPATPWDKK